MPQKISEVTIPITNKFGKFKVSFCRNVVVIDIWNTLILKDVAVMKSDILEHYVQVLKLLPLSLSLVFRSVIWSNLSYSIWNTESALDALFFLYMPFYSFFHFIHFILHD